MTATPSADVPPITLHLHPLLELSDGELFELCQLNRELRIERTAQGELQIMSPSGGKTSNRNVKILNQLGAWTERDGTGEAFDSNAGFVLPNSSMRSPDAAWVPLHRLTALSPEQQERFLPLCPDFVIELRSPSDRLEACQAKLVEYVEQGARLGWLIDPLERRVHVYRPGRPVEVLDDPESVAADPELPGFTLQLAKLWQPWS